MDGTYFGINGKKRPIAIYQKYSTYKGIINRALGNEV